MISSINRIRVILFLIFLSVLVYFYRFKLHQSIASDMSAFERYKSQAVSLIDMKKKWNNTKSTKRKVQVLKDRFKPTSFKQTPRYYELYFVGLSKRKLKMLGNAVLNQPLNIVEMRIKRDKNYASFYIRIKK